MESSMEALQAFVPGLAATSNVVACIVCGSLEGVRPCPSATAAACCVLLLALACMRGCSTRVSARGCMSEARSIHGASCWDSGDRGPS
eukprot:9994964-Alexandrium_andersonii.AAC.1